MRRLLLLIFVVACGGSSSSSSSNANPPQQRLVVQPAGSQSLSIAGPGGTLQLGAYQRTTDPYGGGGLQPVAATWSSSNTAIATVDQMGLVTAVADGTAVITASSDEATGTATVTVGAAAGVVIEWNLGAETTPVVTTVTAGTPVRWHASDTSHSVVADTSPPPETVAVNQGTTTAAQTITAKGTYHYHCGVHPTMTGTLVVQ